MSNEGAEHTTNTSNRRSGGVLARCPYQHVAARHRSGRHVEHPKFVAPPPLAPGTLLRRLPEPWQGLSADHDDGAFGDHASDAVWSRDNDLVFAVFEVGDDVQAGADLALQR